MVQLEHVLQYVHAKALEVEEDSRESFAWQ